MPRQSKKPATAAPKRGRGQPEKEIDLRQVETLCQLQVTDEELGAVLGVSRKTIERRKQLPEFLEAMERGRCKGKVSLRRAQFTAAINGNATMMVWLGKALLAQRDRPADEEKQVEPITAVEFKWVAPQPDADEPKANPKLASEENDEPGARVQ